METYAPASWFPCALEWADLSSNSDTDDYILPVLKMLLPLDGLSACYGAVNNFCSVKTFLDRVSQLAKEAMYQNVCFGFVDALEIRFTASLASVPFSA